VFDHGLSLNHLSLLKSILQPYAKHIERVAIFGSRATGNYKDNSDIDLVIYGDISEESVDRLRTLLNDSNIPYKVDIHGYNHLDYQPFKKHIDEFDQTLFVQAELQDG
jgi:predicted nucleotidyltransferase